MRQRCSAHEMLRAMDDDFRLIELVRIVRVDVSDFLRTSRGRALHEQQLRDSVQSIAANVREAYGRLAGRERNQFFRFACGSCEETDEHLRDNWENKVLPDGRFWTLHNRLAVIVKMLESLMRQGRRRKRA